MRAGNKSANARNVSLIWALRPTDWTEETETIVFDESEAVFIDEAFDPHRTMMKQVLSLFEVLTRANSNVDECIYGSC